MRYLLLEEHNRDAEPKMERNGKPDLFVLKLPLLEESRPSQGYQGKTKNWKERQ